MAFIDWLPYIFGGARIVGSALNSIDQNNRTQSAVDTVTRGQLAALNAELAASQQGIDLQKQIFSYQQQLMQPWYSYGAGAVTTLGDLMGVKPAAMPTLDLSIAGPTGTAPPTSAYPAGTAPPGGFQRAGTNAPVPGGVSTGGVAVPRGSVPPPGTVPLPTPAPTTPAPTPTPPRAGTTNTSALTRTMPSSVSRRTTDGTTEPVTPPNMANAYASVTVQWPDGSTTRVPVSQVARYTSLGATVMGSGATQTSPYSNLQTSV